MCVQFGFDMDEFGGERFTRVAKEGQRVVPYGVIIEIDLPLLDEKAKSTHSSVIIFNKDKVKELIMLNGQAVAGETTVFRVRTCDIVLYIQAKR